jgi:ABC-2 type transport system permease protein
VVNNITVLAWILTVAAQIQELEQGTVEHLLVMPVVAAETMLSKNDCQWPRHPGRCRPLALVVQDLLEVPIVGSLTPVLAGAPLYTLSARSRSCLARAPPPWGSARCSRLRHS